MAAHNLFKHHQIPFVESFGTNTHVKLPGLTRETPIKYDFGVSYDRMYNDLKDQNEQLYNERGLLAMLDRNRNVKRAPERFQMTSMEFDIIISFDERVFDIIVSEFSKREMRTFEPVHLVNLDTFDNQDHAQQGAKDALELVKLIKKEGPGWRERIDVILTEFDNVRSVSHAVGYY
eukprot:TRINITY_DN10007_c0_g1_i1.p1 TRINITY_DN10007_c0_g1~~TRINITY_DN10007_c0_g1_i1.p1  ORF type:complete len:204 (-),score=40.08 TRINITY_DN10007_c0_g1_i1:24-551(-)